jgi:RHS repeat-associated protein
LSDFFVYDSYGNLTESHGDFDQPFGFTGRELDSETGLLYYRARYYDRTIGRFINEDPLGFGGGDVNFYRYAGNSPTGYRDPLGLSSCDKDREKKCLREFYSSPLGRGIDFLSPLGLVPGWSPNTSENLKEILTLSLGKYVGLRGLAGVANKVDTVEILTLSGSTLIPSSAGAGLTAGLKFIARIVPVAILGAGLIDLAVHRACSTYNSDNYVPNQ